MAVGDIPCPSYNPKLYLSDRLRRADLCDGRCPNHGGCDDAKQVGFGV